MKIKINNQKIEIEEGYTILQACKIAGIEIPHFCYHDHLKIAGNCRMCLVELENGPPKPVASCAMPIADGMVIKTNTPTIQKARADVMEMLLINHPLDCPICDQGGECDLQDMSMLYGKQNSNFEEEKRAVPEKNFGPLVKNMMNRCIHCTRCVRFMSDIAGTHELNLINRGENAEIESVFGKPIKSELSGNIIDICPVGALTSKPYAFTARPWELEHFESIDVLDGTGSAIRIDTKEQKVMRILPSRNDDINEVWLSDKSRFSYDGLYLQRLNTPYIKYKNKLVPVSWEEALNNVAKHINKMNKEKVSFIAGDMTDCETLVVAKDIANKIGVTNIDFRQKGERYNIFNRSTYLCNTPIKEIENADCILIIGCNPRYDAPMLNIRIRRSSIENNSKIGYIGPAIDLNYDYQHIGKSLACISDLINKKNKFCKILEKAQKPVLIFGQDLFLNQEAIDIQEKILKISSIYEIVTDSWNGFNMLHKNASSVGALDIGFYSNDQFITQNKDIELVYLLGADNVDPSFLKDKLVIYQGHHGDLGANNADIILPGRAYTEKCSTFVNIEGRVQKASRASFGPPNAKEDWKILNMLAEKLQVNTELNNIDAINRKLSSYGEQFNNINELIHNVWEKDFISKLKPSVLSKNDIKLDETNFYMTNVISRSSKIMSQCLQNFRDRNVS